MRFINVLLTYLLYSYVSQHCTFTINATDNILDYKTSC